MLLRVHSETGQAELAGVHRAGNAAPIQPLMSLSLAGRLTAGVVGT